MCQILVMAIDRTDPDPDRDRRSCYKKGYPVEVMDDDHQWGNEERPPTFIVIQCPDYTKAQVLGYLVSWSNDFGYEILGSNPTQGSYSVRVFENNVSVSGANALTMEKIESYLLKWGCSDLSFTTNSVTFTFRLWQAVQSEAFWGRNLAGITFTLNSYDAGTGVGNITATFDEQKKMGYAAAAIVGKGGYVTDVTATTMTFTIERSVLLQAFRNDVKKKVQKIYCIKRWYIDSSTVDAALSNGGVLALTGNELQATLHDKLME